MNSIQEALKKLRELGSRRKQPLPAISESLVTDIEKSLGLRFPPSYRKFLMSAREHGLHFEEFLWPGTDRDLVGTNQEEHAAELPAFLISFLSDGYGTQVCFDIRSSGSDGEFPIVEWERHMLRSEFQSQDLEPVAISFPEWLIETLEHELEEKRDMEDA